MSSRGFCNVCMSPLYGDRPSEYEVAQEIARRVGWEPRYHKKKRIQKKYRKQWELARAWEHAIVLGENALRGFDRLRCFFGHTQRAASMAQLGQRAARGDYRGVNAGTITVGEGFVHAPSPVGFTLGSSSVVTMTGDVHRG